MASTPTRRQRPLLIGVGFASEDPSSSALSIAESEIWFFLGFGLKEDASSCCCPWCHCCRPLVPLLPVLLSGASLACSKWLELQARTILMEQWWSPCLLLFIWTASCCRSSTASKHTCGDLNTNFCVKHVLSAPPSLVMMECQHVLHTLNRIIL